MTKQIQLSDETVAELLKLKDQTIASKNEVIRTDAITIKVLWSAIVLLVLCIAGMLYLSFVGA